MGSNSILNSNIPYTQWVADLIDKEQEDLICLYTVVCYNVRYARNRKIFEAKETVVDRLIVQARELVDRNLASHNNCRLTAPNQRQSDVKWSSPPSGRFKINIDAASGSDGCWGIGLVVRDSEGYVLVAATRHIETLNDATLAEEIAKCSVLNS
ncbi:hypothetical protein SESBI_22414 [Sesbania bispinosa]|nr:hypothetical protein SESBI_22414 [Sesbania bispinosa]